MIEYSVYILYSQSHDRFYIGSTSDVVRRLAEHNAGRNIETKAYLPWKLIHFEKYDTLSEARNRETLIKSWKNRPYMIAQLDLKF